MLCRARNRVHSIIELTKRIVEILAQRRQMDYKSHANSEWYYCLECLVKKDFKLMVGIRDKRTVIH